MSVHVRAFCCSCVLFVDAKIAVHPGGRMKIADGRQRISLRYLAHDPDGIATARSDLAKRYHPRGTL